MTTDALELEQTGPWRSPGETAGVAVPTRPGRVVGRYRLERVLGEGTYGRVHLARHEVLGRRVAVKVLHHRHGARSEEIRAFLDEALILADLDHPGIVPVLDAGWEEDGLYYIVSKYIERGDLGQLIRAAQLDPRQAASIIEAVAEALQYAHDRGLVHRDIKPANILIGAGGKPCLADFGVALRDKDFGRRTKLTGTPAYMSPEQARGESHRVDGRSDVFSLGIVLYELLTGQRPFRGDTKEALTEQILRCEVRRPRQIDERIPEELERVCLKAMSRSPGKRYPTAWSMAEDLRTYLGSLPGGGPVPIVDPGRQQPAPPVPGSTREYTPTWMTREEPGLRPFTGVMVPRGLRPFEADAADFFPDLLPGPSDRNGLPECIGSWRSRIEGGAEGTFRVGMIFGPSGVGKTSLVKAGLLPRLSGRVLWVYTEASTEGTESRLLQAIRARCPHVPSRANLAATLVAIRKGAALPAGRKMLLVLDRFEQWLRRGRGRRERALVAALRQCDGEHLQALVIVRDDSWLAASRFMRDVDDRIVEGGNAMAVEPFDLGHARRVLEWFGRAYVALPAGAEDLTTDQVQFLDRAVSRLAETGQVLPIRLSIFAEAVKHRPWVPRTLEAVGSTDVSVSFLEAAFGAASGSHDRRRQDAGARSVLAALVTDIYADAQDRGRSHHELLVASGYTRRPGEFEAILHRLIGELGIVSRVESQGFHDGTGDQETGGDEAHFRLSHDFLVEPLREWLARKAADDRRNRHRFPTDGHAHLRPAEPRSRSRKPADLDVANGSRDPSRQIDVNSATEDELRTLPGIGPATARRLIEDRPYRTVDDLLRVRGMSPARLSEIRPFVALG